LPTKGRIKNCLLDTNGFKVQQSPRVDYQSTYSSDDFLINKIPVNSNVAKWRRVWWTW